MRSPVAAVLLGIAALPACGGTPEVRGIGGQGGQNGRDAAPFLADSGALGPARDAGPTEVGDPVGPACATQSVRAERLPLDLYLMLDASYSMLDPTQSGVSKWDAVRTAIRGFMTDPRSVGLGLGLQFFPLTRKEVPEDCYQDGTCGNFGPCLIVKTCSPATTVRICDTAADCSLGQSCIPLGGCSRSDALCAPVGNVCGGVVGGDPPGNACEQIPGYCIARDLCEPGQYGTPAVAVAELPAAGTALGAALDGRRPEGRTPLGPAMQGAIAHARDRIMRNPGRRVAVVLASDGQPSVCMPGELGGVVALVEEGARGAPSVPTFAVGVVTVREQAKALADLGLIARAGGTARPYVITTGQNVEQQFLSALDAIRTTALTCEFKLPAPSGAGALDLTRVNVRYTAGDGQVVTLGNVASAQACDPTRGGWHYDVDPGNGGRPTSIVTCPATCDKLKVDERGRVDIVLGCRTIVE